MARRLFSPKEKGQLRVFVFFSGGGSAMKYLLEEDSNCGNLYQIVGAFTDNKEASGLKVATSHDIPVEILDRGEFFEKHPNVGRKVYYKRVLDKIKPYKPDLITMSGYMDIVRYPIIESSERRGEFTNKILNIHPADLGVLKKKQKGGGQLPLKVLRIPKSLASKTARKIIELNDLERAYKGEDAVTDAILNGEDYTQSTCHIAQRKFDEGPIITQSKRFPVRKTYVKRKLKSRDWGSIIEYAKQLQEQMKWQGDGPTYAKALEIIAEGRLSIKSDEFTLLLNDEELPYCGLQLH